MRSLCRLSVASVAPFSALILFCLAGAHAQTPAPPAPLHNPIPFVTPVLPPLSGARSSAPQLPAPSTTLRVPPISPGTIQRLQALDAQKLTLLSGNEGPCYALRTYGFTAGHDPAEAPHLSSHTTCTPASQSHAKAIVATPPGH